MTENNAEVTPEEGRRLFEAVAKRRGKEPSCEEIALAFASVGRSISSRTVRRWRLANWTVIRPEPTPFSRAMVAFTNLTDAFGFNLRSLVPGVAEIQPPTAERALNSYEAMLTQADAMTMAQLLEVNARMMLTTSMLVQKIVHDHGVDLALKNPTGLSQILNHLGKWNDHIYRSCDAVVMLRERSMKLGAVARSEPVEETKTNVLRITDYYVPGKLGERAQLMPDDPLNGV